MILWTYRLQIVQDLLTDWQVLYKINEYIYIFLPLSLITSASIKSLSPWESTVTSSAECALHETCELENTTVHSFLFW